MNKLFLAVAVVIFIVVAGIITINITKTIFVRVVNDLTPQIANSIVGGTAQKIEKKPCNLSHNRKFKNEPYYNGPLIDSHVHFPTSSQIVSSIAGQNGLELPILKGDLSAENLICLFESEGITKTFAFHLTSQFEEGASVSTAKAIEEAYPARLVHFIMPPPLKSLNLSPSGIKKILEDNKGLFKGFGEVALYMDGYEGVKPNDSDLKAIYKLAEQHNLIVMVHPEDGLKDGVEEILREYPNVTFFFHGGRNQEWIIELMPKYQNFYYSVDADVSHLYGFKKEHQYQKLTTQEEYLSYIRSNFDSVLKEEVAHWKPKIEKYPERFTWGTDRWYVWHFDPEVGGILEEFGRSFIGGLDPAVRENFAYKNAEKMLK